MPRPVKEEDFIEETDSGEDELEDDEEDSGPVFKLRERVPISSACNRLMSELNDMVAQGAIDLCPPYQRGVVWTKVKQMNIIDSVFQGIYIPPVVFNVTEDEDGNPVRTCIDGKQRLTSITNFLQGQIPYKDEKKKLWWYTRPDNLKKSRQQIPAEYKEWFRNRTLTCVEYPNLTAENEREIFQRVQLGVPLTSAEKLQAHTSPTASWLEELEAKYLSSPEGLDNTIKFDQSRGRDYQNLAQLVYCCEGLPNDQRFATSNKMTEWIKRPESLSPRLMRGVERALKDFCRIASDKTYNQAFRLIEKKVAPVEFVFIGVLLYQLHDETKNSKALAIHSLREAIRDEFRDIRSNKPTVKAFWNYVGQLVVEPLNPVQRGGEKEAPVIRKGPPKGVKKRKAEDDDDDTQHKTGPSKSRKRKS